MNMFTETLLKNLDLQLKEVAGSTEDRIKSAGLSVRIVEASLKQLKEYIIAYHFKTKQEEIRFFKETKPQFTSRLVVHNKLLNIESHKPAFGNKALKKYLQNELNKLHYFYLNNYEFYSYYRSGSDYLDTKYFMRQQHDLLLNTDSLYFEADHRFTTSHDYKVARIMAYDQLIVILENDISKNCKPNENEPGEPGYKFKWTESKSALIELVYALHAQEVINNGNADIKDIASFFEKIFGISLGDYYRGFLDIKVRKTGKTKFLDSLKESLIKRIDEAEERVFR